MNLGFSVFKYMIAWAHMKLIAQVPYADQPQRRHELLKCIKLWQPINEGQL
jgi:hypothetical protein